MKKLFIAALILALSAVFLTSCGKSDAVRQVEALIKAIDSDVGLQSGENIRIAQEAFDYLPEKEQSKVSNRRKLENAAAKYEELSGLNDYVNKMIESAGASFSKDDFNVSEMLGQYDEMVSLYQGLKDDEKEQIAGFDQLEAAVSQMRNYDTAAQEAAAAYVRGFMEVYKDKGFTVTAVGCIKQIRDDKEYHFFSLTYKDKEGKEHNAYSTARFVGANVISTIIARPDIFFAAKPATEDTDCLTHGNVTIDVAATIEAAQKLTVEKVPTTTATTTAPATTAPATTVPATTAPATTAAATTAAATTAAAETTTAG